MLLVLGTAAAPRCLEVLANVLNQLSAAAVANTVVRQ